MLGLWSDVRWILTVPFILTLDVSTYCNQRLFKISSHICLRELWPRGHIISHFCFFWAWMLTRHSVEYAKDWLDTFHRLSWSSLVKYLLVWKGMFLLCSVLPAPSGVVCLQKGVWYGFDQMDAVINHFRVHEAILAWWQTNKRQPGDPIASLLLLSEKAAF